MKRRLISVQPNIQMEPTRPGAASIAPARRAAHFDRSADIHGIESVASAGDLEADAPLVDGSR